MLRGVFFLIATIYMASALYASQSTITDAEGYACMGEDKSRKQTEHDALTDAKRNAAENALTYIKSETRVKESILEKDLIEAYANASVKLIQELGKGWYNDASTGDCFRIRIKAEITPDIKIMERISKDKSTNDDPSAPLKIQIWTDKKSYRQGEKIRVYIKGNKPFYARVTYKDAREKIVQLLPNPYRAENYFNGGPVYEIPSGKDNFELEVGPPFGKEEVIVYASTSILGDIDLEQQGGIYKIRTGERDIGDKTRGVKIKRKESNKEKEAAASEFYEEKIVLETGR